MGGGVWSVLSFLNLTWWGLLYFCRSFALFEISHKVKDKNLSGQLSAVSTNSIPGPAFAQHGARRRFARYLLFTAFGAITATSAWAAQTQSNVEMLLDQARSKEKTGDYAAAERIYELARIYKNASLRSIELLKALDVDSFQLHALMGEVYADEERYPEAIEQYQAALAKRPDAQGIHYAIGIAYWAQLRLDLAEKEFRDAWKENPNDALTNLYLGDIAVRDQRFSEAFRFLLV